MKTDSLQDDLFAFAERQYAKPAEAAPPASRLRHGELRQAAIAFLASLKPDGMAERVALCGRRTVTAAGFWRSASGKKKNRVKRTAIVILYENADDCFAECADRESRLRSLDALNARREELEARIRREEPHLAAADDLFKDCRTWDYEASSDPEYHRVRRKLAQEMHSLCHGSPMDRFRACGVADLCYLAVPAGLIPPGHVAPEWGLVELMPEGKRFRLLRKAQEQNGVTPEGREKLLFQIALAAAGAVRFSAGVELSGALRKPPRRRSYLHTK